MNSFEYKVLREKFGSNQEMPVCSVDLQYAMSEGASPARTAETQQEEPDESLNRGS